MPDDRSSSQAALSLDALAKAEPDTGDVPPGEKPNQFSLVLLACTILFSGTHWGIISFTAATLREDLDLSYTQIGSLVPIFGVVYIASTFVCGLVADKLPQKLLLLTGTTLNAGGLILVLSGSYPIMAAGYGLVGIGYAPWTIVPYVQLALFAGNDRPKYDKWYLVIEIAFVLSFSLGRLMTMAIVSTVDRDSLAWRLPFIIVAAGQVFFLFLTLLFGRYAAPLPEKKSEKEAERYDYPYKLRALYCNPMAAILLLGSCCNAFSTYALAAWAPTFALERFERTRDEGQINVSVAAAVFVAWPVGMVATIFALRHSSRIAGAMRISFVFVAVAAAFVCVYATITDYFWIHIGSFVLFAAFANFPGVLYKQLPLLLGFPPEVAVFALSRFTLAYSISGDVAGWLLTGVLIDEYGINTAVWAIAGVAIAAAAFWGVLFVWSFMGEGPVHDRTVQEMKSERALTRWGTIRQRHVTRMHTSRIVALAIGSQRGRNILYRMTWGPGGYKADAGEVLEAAAGRA